MYYGYNLHRHHPSALSGVITAGEHDVSHLPKRIVDTYLARNCLISDRQRVFFKDFFVALVGIYLQILDSFPEVLFPYFCRVEIQTG